MALLLIITGIDTCRSQFTRQPTYGARWLKLKTAKRKEGESTALRGACLCSPSGSEESSKKLSSHKVCMVVEFVLLRWCLDENACFHWELSSSFALPTYMCCIHDFVLLVIYLKYQTKYSYRARVCNHEQSELKRPNIWNTKPNILR